MKHLDLDVFEFGDALATMSKDGRIVMYRVGDDGMPVVAGSPLTAHLGKDDGIEVLKLTVRTYNCLQREGLRTVGALLDFYDEKGLDGFRDIRNFGEKNTKEILDTVTNLRRGA